MYQGINKTIECASTGALALFHRIEYYSVDLRSKYTTLVVNGYVSQDAFEKGKQAIVSTNVTLQAAPGTDDVALNYFYEELVTMPQEPVVDAMQPHMPTPTNMFAGAELVHD